MSKHYIAKFLSLLILSFWLSGCSTPNIPYHTSSSQSADDAETETHKEAGIVKQDNYDLAFVEFSDRGNVFDRKQMDAALQLVKQYAESDGVTVVTFIHGWKHNSQKDDSNLADFKRLLASTAAKAKTKNLKTPRRLVGIFISWRGLSVKIPVIKNLSYWSRKKVAHNVGRGGITELLLRLERTVYANDPNSTKNILINTGHSFGGAILLSALNDVLMSRMLDTEIIDGCIKTKPFGHANILINPAVEANEIFQLKELVKQHPCYDNNQSKLLHVISSDADRSTKAAFTIGQWLGLSLRRKETTLEREYATGKGNAVQKFKIREKLLDTRTIANFPTFRTGRSIKRNKNQKFKQQCASSDQGRNECYIPCKNGNHACVSEYEKRTHIPVVKNEPLSFVYTDKEFMKSHTDVFNSHIVGYITAITRHAQFKYNMTSNKKSSLPNNAIEPECLSKTVQNKFNFGSCFSYFTKVFSDLDEQKENNQTTQ